MPEVEGTLHSDKVSEDDKRALAWLLGGEYVPQQSGPHVNRLWHVQSTVSSDAFYTIEERKDKHGGIYLWCSCPSWKFRFGKGEHCKHIRMVMDNDPMFDLRLLGES